MSNISRYLKLSRKRSLTPKELEEWNSLQKWVDEIGKEEYNEVRKEYISRINKYKRIKKFIEDEYSYTNNNYFVTFTINDDNINRVRETFLYQFRKIFRGHSAVLNTDYGEVNNRLHFHAICFDINDTSFLEQWKYGFISVKKIRRFEDKEQLAKYVSKLCNHALKVNCHIIYYRK